MKRIEASDNPACECGTILIGAKQPADCKLFGTVCTPETPMGSCMVSSEGACAAHWTYGRFRDKAGYDATMEHTVYVRADARGGGIGRALLQSLVGIARLRGVHALLGALSSENTGSLALHRSLGFVEVGRMPQVGRKFDRWLDLVWVELLLDGDDRA